MSVNLNPSDYYSNKKFKINLNRYKTDDINLNKKLDAMQIHLDKGFTLYSTRIMERFLQGHNDIPDFGVQFVLLEDYYSKNNKYSNSEEQYIIQYGITEGKKRWNEKIEKVSGDNNPWSNHGGKLSPWKKGSVNYSKEAIKKACSQRSYNTKIEYYTDKGYSLEEAEELLKERQSTGRLSKFIDRYGEDEGIRKWKERQEKWQNTLNSKTQEEIDDINRRKSSGIGRYLDRTIPGKLYYIKFFNDEIEFWKIGITSNSINERFNLDTFDAKHNLKHEIIFQNEYNSIQEAYDKEQFILALFNENRITIDYNNFFTTETFNSDVLKGFYEVI